MVGWVSSCACMIRSFLNLANPLDLDNSEELVDGSRSQVGSKGLEGALEMGI